MRISMTTLIAGALAAYAGTASAQQSTTVAVIEISEKGSGAPLGTVVFTDTPHGLAIDPKLKGLPPGPHGFHVHENPSCAAAAQDGKMVPGLAAGGHYDPKGTKAHRGPHQHDGHLGDLPPLVADKDGAASAKLLAPRLKVADLRGRSLIIHANGDNFDDKPQPLGGGGGRIACGVFDVKIANSAARRDPAATRP
ncbi:MAG: superoxide dismutase family protein [Rhodospirillales bacterium]|nr:MAG: superoxide dismutase family protein [Rhodospirillales bacterium]